LQKNSKTHTAKPFTTRNTIDDPVEYTPNNSQEFNWLH
jgi:hypothetical protein